MTTEIKNSELAAGTTDGTQGVLFKEEDSVVAVGGRAFKDPAFGSNKTTAVHRWVPWIAGFSANFVAEAIGRHLKNPGVVLDPFAGVGTTLVEALLAGHSTVGFEINPYAALACRAKLHAFSIESSAVARVRKRFSEFYGEAAINGYKPLCRPPEGFKTRGEFYSEPVLRKVLITNDFIRRLKNEQLRDLFRIAFASTMVVYSNYSYEPSLGQRKSAGRPNVDDFPVGEFISAKLDEMTQDIAAVSRAIDGRDPHFRVLNESFFESSQHVDAGTVDLLITSPPYLNNYHYNRNTRPHLYWLGFVKGPGDMKPIEEANFGKYWQTVRDRERVELDFASPNPELVDQIEKLRTLNPHKGIYGGNGWANYAASYFSDCFRFAQNAKRLLKRRGRALIVIGNSILQGIMIPTDRYLAEIAESVGLEVIGIDIPRSKRVGSSIIHSEVRVEKARAGHHLYEAVVELRKR